MHEMELTTGVIDWPLAIEAVEKAMQGAALECRFDGNRREKGTFTFRLPDMTLDEFDTAGVGHRRGLAFGGVSKAPGD